MTGVELPKVVCNRIKCLSLLLLVVSVPINTTSKAEQPIRTQTQIPPPSDDPETQAYRQWYIVLAARNRGRVIEGGESFLKQYPEGKYAGFVTRIIDMARVCLNAKQRNTAEVWRAQVKASLKDSSEQLQDLLSKILNDEAGVDEKNHTGATALMYAAASGEREALRALIHKDADIDAAENTHGWTALIYALWSGNHLIVDDLLQYYPDTGIKDTEGWTALDHAEATADFEILLTMNARPRLR
jgi:hypothetical protein